MESLARSGRGIGGRSWRARYPGRGYRSGCKFVDGGDDTTLAECSGSTATACECSSTRCPALPTASISPAWVWPWESDASLPTSPLSGNATCAATPKVSDTRAMKTMRPRNRMRAGEEFIGSLRNDRRGRVRLAPAGRSRWRERSANPPGCRRRHYDPRRR